MGRAPGPATGSASAQESATTNKRGQKCAIYVPQLSQGDENVLAGVTEREVTSTEAMSSGVDQADVDGTAAFAPGEGGRRSGHHISPSLNVAAAGCPCMLPDDRYRSWRGSAATWAWETYVYRSVPPVNAGGASKCSGYVARPGIPLSSARKSS
jgi:hypothetical protein